ncbi:PSME3-interacting protein-like [Chironomus tepperi]|uniref:PSME3-interacting protein-like n=1 Tax=Chironomus tepperi TaxID=113505 RepID=UPI00391EF203
MSFTKRDIEKLIREDDWKKVLNVNKFEETKSEDLRPLKLRLKEQQEIKAQAWKESFKSIVGIDEEDADHLKNVSEMKLMIEKQIKEQDSLEIENFRRQSAKIKEEETALKRHELFTKQKVNSKDSNSVNKQKSLLLAGIKRKSDEYKLNAKHSKGPQADKSQDKTVNK